MRFAGRTLLMAFLFTLSLSAEAFGQELYLSNTVVMAGDTPTLGSIALITGGGNGTQLSKLLSTPLPVLADHPALIPARDLRKELSQAIESSFVLVGGPVIYLPASVSGAAEQSFYSSLLQEIESVLPEQSLRIEVWSAGGQEPDMTGLHGRLEFVFPAGTGTPNALASNGYVEYRGSGESTYRYLPVHIRVEELVPVARHEIRYGTQFSSDAVSFVARDISSLNATPARLSGKLFQAKSAIAKGSVIYSDMAGKVQAIKAGQQIRISFRKGNVAVTVPGSAYQSGGLGDTISVAPANTATRYEATIVSPTEAIVED